MTEPLVPMRKKLDDRVVGILARHCLHRIDDNTQACVECGLTVKEITTNQRKTPPPDGG